MSEKKKKLLNLMRFWLFGTFVIVWAAVTAYIGLFTNRNAWVAIKAGFPIWGITGVLCIVWYFAYRWWLGRKPDEMMASGEMMSPPEPMPPQGPESSEM